MTNIVELDSSTKSKIKSVTVYTTGKAEVVRTYELNLKEGENEIRVTSLSSHMDHQSVRVSGLGSAARLVDIICTTKTGNLMGTGGMLRALQKKKQRLEAEKLIRQQETDVYLSYAKSISTQHVSTQHLVPIMQRLVQERKGILDAITSLDEQINAVDEAITEESANSQSGDAAGYVTLYVYVDPALVTSVPLCTMQSSIEPEDSWKKDVKGEIDAQFAPDIALLMKDKVDKQSEEGLTPLRYEHIEHEYDAHMMRYISLANQRYEERLEAERLRRKILIEQHLSASFTLSYIVSNASWKPLYDIHAQSQEQDSASSVVLHYRASVMQHTGEDWLDAPLVLSTASDATHSTKIPRLPIYRIQPQFTAFAGFGQRNDNGKQAHISPMTPIFGQPAAGPTFNATSLPTSQTSGSIFGRNAPPTAAGGLFGFSATTGTVPNSDMSPPTLPASSFGGFGTAAPVAPDLSTREQGEQQFADQLEATNISLDDDVDAPTTRLRTSPVSVSYAVNHAVRIPSDGATHTVSVTIVNLDSEISRVCIPRMQAIAYFQCKIRNKSDYLLVAGPVNVFLDDSFVTRTSIKNVMPNESFECTLGTDPGLRVTYERLPGKAHEQHDEGYNNMYGERKRTTTYVVRTYITNSHPFGIKNLIVCDALPVAAADTVQVILRKPSGLAHVRAEEDVEVVSNVKVRWSAKAKESTEAVEGKYEWLVSLDGGKDCTLETEWEVQTPLYYPWKEVAETQ